MALLHECPKCHRRYSLSRKKCKCGVDIGKLAGKAYWIEYYNNGRRERERIGKSKNAAEQRLREVLTKRTEGRYIRKIKDLRVTFSELAKWYLELPQIKAKKSYDRDQLSVRTLEQYFRAKTVQEITTVEVENYRLERLAQKSPRKQLTRPATVNREIACLRRILHLAVNEKKIEEMPYKGLVSLKENNKRDRILSEEEYRRLLSQCMPQLARIVMMAYHTAMRQGEILKLTWDCLDMKDGLIRLSHEMTKTDESRVIPLTPELVDMLDQLPRHISGRVFTVNGKPVSDIKKSFKSACRRAGIKDFTFHDLRHTAINNWRQQGHDYFKIMAASGHKTMSVFKRYNTVTENEVKTLVENRFEASKENIR